MKAKRWLSAALRKSLRGTPAFTPKENGCANADAAPNQSRSSGLIILGTGERGRRFPLSEALLRKITPAG